MDKLRVIYEKKFPHLSVADCEQIYTEVNTGFVTVPKKNPAMFCKQFFESTVQILMPERVQNCDFFISIAKRIAGFYEIDTIVTEHDDHLSAEFRIDCDNTYSGLKKIIELADDICFQVENNNIVLHTTYYTHATYRSGRRIIPEEDLDLMM